MSRLYSDRWALFLLVSGAYLAIAMSRAPVAFEDSHSYERWARALIERRYDFELFLRDIEWRTDLRLYRSWISIVAVAIEIFGPDWKQAIVALNVVCYSISAWLVLTLVRRIDSLADARILAALLLVVVWDYVYWVRHVLADASMNMIAVIALVMVHRSFCWPGRIDGRLWWSGAFVVALGSLTFKPQGLGVLGFVLFSALIYPFLGSLDSHVLARRLRWLFGMVFVVIVVVVVAFGAAVFDPSLVPNDWLRVIVETEMRDYGRDGSIVWQRYETYVAPPSDALGYAAMVAIRMAYMFAIYGRDYSSLHKAVNLAGFVPLYAFAAIGCWSILSGRTPAMAQKLGALAMAMIIVLTLLHSLTALDYDWRYRVPLIAPMIVLATIGWRALRPARDI